MPRPIWTGTISFGLLNIPVTLHTAERTTDLHFRMLDSRDKNPIRYERINAETGEEVPWKDVVKAFEYSKGSYVVVEDDDLRSVAPEVTQTVAVEAFVDVATIDPMYFEKPYYLVPGKRAEKGYVLLRELLAKTGKVGIGRVVIRTRQYLCMLYPKQRALVLDLLRFEQELIPLSDFALPAAGSHKISAAELKMAQTLLESMSSTWKPADYKDEFRSKLRKMLDARAAKHKGTVRRVDKKQAAVENATTNVVDLMALLKKSLDSNTGKPHSRNSRHATRHRRRA
jgi:DNA end-binding protein Ku